MLRSYGAGLGSDAIVHRYGFDGREPGDVTAMIRRHARLGLRSTFAINTHYPEIKGGYFENRALYELIENAIRALGLLPVLWDCYSHAPASLNPVEGKGQLLVGECYALLDELEEQRGLLQLWKFNVGGGGDHYQDNVIFDLVLPSEPTQRLVDDVEQRCSRAGVAFGRDASIETTS